MAERGAGGTAVAAGEIGRARPRVEARRAVRGEGGYVDDHGLPRMLHAVFVRSPHAHARVTTIETTAARAMPGVRAVLTAADLRDEIAPIDFTTGIEGHRVPRFPALAEQRVRFDGDPVAVVLAESRAQAADAAARVEVGYAVLPCVLGVEAASDPSSPVLHTDLGSNVVYDDPPDEHVYGDVDGAFARADRIVHATVRSQRHGGVPLEARGGLASFDPGTGELRYRVTAQSAHSVRHQLARHLGLDHQAVHVVIGDVGGAFGSKWSVSREDIVVCAAARRCGRPVRWTEDRAEALRSAGSAREDTVRMEAAVTDGGELLAVRAHVVMNQGAYPTAAPMPAIADLVRVTLPAALRLPAFGFRATVVASNKSPYFTYRGPGAVETLARERLLDAIARELDLDPVELRRRETITAAEQPASMATGATLDRVTVRETLDRAVAQVDLPAFRAEQRVGWERGVYRGVGIVTSLQPNPAFADWWQSWGSMQEPEPVRLAVGPDGRVTVLLSQAPGGQGHETTMAQIGAAELSVPFESVRVVTGDSDRGAFFFFGTSGSGNAPMTGGAVAVAARRLRAQLERAAAAVHEVAADGVELRDGAFTMPDGSVVPLRALAEHVHLRPDRSAATVFDLELAHSFRRGPGGWWCATAACWVDVDVDLGTVRLERFLVVHDCGTAINPAVVRGQLQGGVAQGIGGALYEEHAYADDGRMIARDLHDYLLPRATEIPPIEIVTLPPASAVDLDFRGVGEGGAVIASAAVVQAVEDALRPFGARFDQLPLRPELVRTAIVAGTAGTERDRQGRG